MNFMPWKRFLKNIENFTPLFLYFFFSLVCLSQRTRSHTGETHQVAVPPLWMCWAPARDSTQQLDWNQKRFMYSVSLPKHEKAGGRLPRLWWSPRRREVRAEMLRYPIWKFHLHILSLCPCVCVRVCVFVSAPPAHEPSHGASRRSPGSQSAVVMGTGQWWPVACSLLHSSVQGAARQQLDCPLCIGQPWDKLLHSGQVVIKVYFLEAIDFFMFLLYWWRI